MACVAVADDNGKVADFLIQDLDTVNQLSAYGRQLYDNDVDQIEAIDYCSSSLAYMEAGEFRQALRDASKNLYLGQQIEDDFLQSVSLRNMAMAYNFAGDLANAERFAKMVLDKYSDQKLNVVGPVYKVMGDVRLRQQRYSEAIDYYNKAFDNSPPFLETMTLASLARAYTEAKQYDKAREYFDKAAQSAADAAPIEQKNKLKGIYARSAATWIKPTLIRGRADLAYLQGDYDKAISLYESVATVAKGDAYQSVWIQYGKAKALWAKGDKQAALLAIDQAVSQAEAVRAAFHSEEFKISLFSNVQDIFDNAIDMYMASGKPEQALIISEKSRARALLDMVRNRVKTSSGGQAISDALEKVASTAQIQSAVPADTALVVYHINPAHSYAWVVRKDGIKAITLDTGRVALANRVRTLRAQISQIADVDAASSELYQLLVQPLQLKKNEKIIFVPHKSLHFLPFQALKGKDGYLIETHQLRQSPSASILALKHGQAKINGQLLALGNPKLSSAKLDLPGAQAEVESIAKLYSSPKVYVREQATRNHVIGDGPGSQVIHIAAHAEVDELDPLYSRILLSKQGDDPRNKDLEAKDIYSIDLHNTSLVVLSACRSGLGEVSGGDEIMGFTRTFISAGAGEVVVSLWDVEDTATRELMIKFYQAAQKSDLATSMQQAELAVMKDARTRHPIYWAGFNLVGAI